MKIKSIVIEFLEKNKCDGLINIDTCACKLDDLMPCDEPGLDCEAGRIKNCNQCDEKSQLTGKCSNGYDFCLENCLLDKQ